MLITCGNPCPRPNGMAGRRVFWRVRPVNLIIMRIISLLFITFFSLTYTVNAQEYSTTSGDIVTVTIPSDVTLLNVSIKNGAELKTGDNIREGDFIALIVDKSHNKITITSGITGKITYINKVLYKKFAPIPAGTTLLKIENQNITVQSTETEKDIGKLSLTRVFKNLMESTDLYALLFNNAINWTEGVGRMLMIGVGLDRKSVV